MAKNSLPSRAPKMALNSRRPGEARKMALKKAKKKALHRLANWMSTDSSDKLNLRHLQCRETQRRCKITGTSITAGKAPAAPHRAASPSRFLHDLWHAPRSAPPRENRPQDRSLHSRRKPRKLIHKRPWTDAEPQTCQQGQVTNLVQGLDEQRRITKEATAGTPQFFCTVNKRCRGTINKGHVSNLSKNWTTTMTRNCNCGTTTVFSTVSPSTRPPPQPPRPHLRLHRPARTSAPTPTRSSRPKPHACCHVRPPRTAPWYCTDHGRRQCKRTK